MKYTLLKYLNKIILCFKVKLLFPKFFLNSFKSLKLYIKFIMAIFSLFSYIKKVFLPKSLKNEKYKDNKTLVLFLSGTISLFIFSELVFFKFNLFLLFLRANLSSLSSSIKLPRLSGISL